MVLQKFTLEQNTHLHQNEHKLMLKENRDNIVALQSKLADDSFEQRLVAKLVNNWYRHSNGDTEVAKN